MKNKIVQDPPFTMQIEPTEADAAELSDAIKEAGYTPVAVPDAAAACAPSPAAGQCCCG